MQVKIRCKDCGYTWDLENAEKWLTHEALNGEEYIRCPKCNGLAKVLVEGMRNEMHRES